MDIVLIEQVDSKLAKALAPLNVISVEQFIAKVLVEGSTSIAEKSGLTPEVVAARAVELGRQFPSLPIPIKQIISEKPEKNYTEIVNFGPGPRVLDLE